MDFRFTEEQEELREMARAFLAQVSGPEQVRTAMASELGHDPEVWKRIAAELGWPSVQIPEAYGGLGLSDIELIALMEVMGEALLCSPFFASVCLGANALLVAGSEEQKRTQLPAIAKGVTIATLAHAESEGGWDAADVASTFRSDGGEILLSGTKRFVVDGHCADLIVVSARAEGTSGRDGLALFLVPGNAAGLERTLLPTMDQTRRLAQLELADVRVPASARLGEAGADPEEAGADPEEAGTDPDEAGPGLGEAGADALDEILQRAAIALAAEQVGGAQRCLEMAVAYAKEREQYGRPIGSFQAIKHKCADMMVKVESARSALYYAACVAAENDDRLALAASMAKSAASDAYFFNAGTALQIFGGVGFTWEYDIHLYFKRARSSTSLLGDVVHHRERIARALGL